MCLLIVKPAGPKLKRNWLMNGAESNPHGCGAAWVGDKGLRYCRGVVTAESFADLTLKRIKRKPAIVHFRLATHGDKDDANCHPFPLIHGWMMAHNGIISGLDHPTKSDTAMYADIIIARLTLEPDYLDKPESEFQMSVECEGSKLGFLHESGKYVIVNEEFGKWEDGVWFSNDGHKPFRYFGWYDKHKSGFATDWNTDWETSFDKRANDWDKATGWPDGEVVNTHEPWSKDIGAENNPFDPALQTTQRNYHLCSSCNVPLLGDAMLGEDNEWLCRDCNDWQQLSQR